MTSKILTISAALALLGGAPAAAQPGDWLGTTAAYGGDDYRAPYADARRAAYDNGYKDGVKRGERAARDGKPFNARLEREYRDAQNGYNRSYGDRARYRDDYRGGFAEGYRDGFGGRDGRSAYPGAQVPNGNRRETRGYGYGGNAGYGAFQNGVGDGYRKALEDIEDRKSPDATRHKWYRSGDRDYDKAYGSKDAYKIEYRRGFQAGYSRAFRDGRRY
jgi:hypothetical protein